MAFVSSYMILDKINDDAFNRCSIVFFETRYFSFLPSTFIVHVANQIAYTAPAKPPSYHARYRSLVCPHVFQLTCTNETHKSGVKDKIVDMVFNRAGARDTARVLKIGINIVLRALKHSP